MKHYMADVFWYRWTLLRCWVSGHDVRDRRYLGGPIQDCRRCGRILTVNGKLVS